MHWARKDIAILPAIPLPLSAAQDDRDLLCWILPDFTNYDSRDADDLEALWDAEYRPLSCATLWRT